MECPVCDDVNLAISSREGVEIDYCPQCRGVWLDRGELDKIIDRVNGPQGVPSPAAAAAPPPPQQERYDDRRDDRRDDRYDDRSYKKKKRGSFLEDIFDF